MMGDQKALQFLYFPFSGGRRIFAQAFEVKYLDQTGVLQHCWTTSWGAFYPRPSGRSSWCTGDDQGINYAATDSAHSGSNCPDLQNRRGKKASVQGTAKDLESAVGQGPTSASIWTNAKVFSPGWKFNDWEMRGVPVRVELGPKDVRQAVSHVGPARLVPAVKEKSAPRWSDLPATIEKIACGNSQVALRQCP